MGHHQKQWLGVFLIFIGSGEAQAAEMMNKVSSGLGRASGFADTAKNITGGIFQTPSSCGKELQEKFCGTAKGKDKKNLAKAKKNEAKIPDLEACKEADESLVHETWSCDNLISGSGSINQSYIKKQKDELDKLIAKNKCDKGNVGLIQDRVRSLTAKQKEFNAAVTAQSDCFSKFSQSQRDQFTVQAINPQLELEARIKSLDDRLNNRSNGLVSLMNEVLRGNGQGGNVSGLTSGTAGISNEIEQFKNLQEDLAETESAFQVMKADYTIGYTKRCMSAEALPAEFTRSGGSCTKQKDINIQDYIVCVAGAGIGNIGSNGQGERDSFLVSGNKNTEVSTLKGVFENINQNSAVLPTSAQNIQTNNRLFKTPDDIQKRYGSYFQSLNNKYPRVSSNGQGLGSFIQQQYQNCYQKAQSQVQANLSAGSGGNVSQGGNTAAEASLRSLSRNLDKVRRNVSTKSSDLFKNYNRVYSKVRGALNGTTRDYFAAQDLENCANPNKDTSTASNQLRAQCLDQMKTSFDNLMDNLSSTILIQGKSGAFPVQCRGLSGCITTLQNLSTQYQNQERPRLKQIEEQIVQKMNDQMDAEIKTFQSSIEVAQGCVMDEDLKAINGSRLLSAGLTLDTMQDRSDLQTEQKGSYKGLPVVPTSSSKFLALVGSGVLYNLKDGEFKSEISNLNEKKKKLQDAADEAGKTKQSIDTQANKCLKDKRVGDARLLNTDISNLIAANCFKGGTNSICTKPNSVDLLTKAIKSISIAMRMEGYQELQTSSNVLNDGLQECQDLPPLAVGEPPRPRGGPACNQISGITQKLNAISSDTTASSVSGSAGGQPQFPKK